LQLAVLFRSFTLQEIKFPLCVNIDFKALCWYLDIFNFVSRDIYQRISSRIMHIKHTYRLCILHYMNEIWGITQVSLSICASRRMKALDVGVSPRVFCPSAACLSIKAFSHHLHLSLAYIYLCAWFVCFLQLRGNTRDVLFRCIYAARVSSALFAYFVNIGGAATSNARARSTDFPKPICVHAV
jgi:hypothetical protein